MKKILPIIALAALIIPALLRGIWFYRGIAERPKIATPDFASFSAPKAPVNSTAINTENIKQFGGVVLFDTMHGNQFSMSNVESLTKAITQRGGQVELIGDAAMLESKLKYASAFIEISPTALIAEDEKRVLKNFVERGGRLMVFTDATRNSIYFDYTSGNPIAYGDVNAANSLLTPFDISINDDYLYNLKNNEGNFRNVFFDQFGKNELTFGLKQIALYGTHSVESPSGLLLLRGAESNLSSTNDANDPAQGGAALSADGNVIAFGDFTFMASPYDHYADNASLISNLADFALSGKQTATLSNFPYIFNANIVRVYSTSELHITPELISALGRLQTFLQSINIKMEIADKAPGEGDAIILGTFTPSDDLTPFTNLFGITSDTEKNTIKLPEFGNINSTGNGIILLNKNKKGNNLTLLSDTQDDLIALMDTINTGNLSSCVLQNNTGVCGVGFGGGTDSGSTGDSSAAAGTPPAGTATATPAASGKFSP